MLPERYVELAKTHGVSLDEINPGSHEVAFKRSVTLDVLRSLNGTVIAVLGGDVFRRTNDHLEYAYANWYCNKVSSEDFASYAERSRREAIAYVENFKGAEGFEPLFVLVLSDTG